METERVRVQKEEGGEKRSEQFDSGKGEGSDGTAREQLTVEKVRVQMEQRRSGETF